MHLTPVTSDPDVAADWFSRFEGAGLDGVVAKPADLHYQPDKRAMLKVKHERTADCVVAGFRRHKDGAGVGSLLLGLYDEAGRSTTSAWPRGSARPGAGNSSPSSRRTGPTPGGPPLGGLGRRGGGRAPGRDEPLERRQGHELGAAPARAGLRGRLRPPPGAPLPSRHVLRRWRPDRQPASCTYAQLDTPVPTELSLVFETG